MAAINSLRTVVLLEAASAMLSSALIQDDKFHTLKGGGGVALHGKYCADKEDNRRPPLRRLPSHGAVDVCHVIAYKK